MTDDRPQPKPTKEWIDACREDCWLAVDAIEDWARISLDCCEVYCEFNPDAHEGENPWHLIPPDIPQGYWELTDAIVLWSDAVIKSIDPAPFIEYRRQIIACSRTEPGEVREPVKPSPGELEELMYGDVQNTHRRLINATLALPDERKRLATPQPDGPDLEESGVFWWQGQRRLVGKKGWKLMRACWDAKDGVQFEDLRGEVFESCTPPATIRAAVCRLNKEMEANGIPIIWETNSEYVQRVCVGTSDSVDR